MSLSDPLPQLPQLLQPISPAAPCGEDIAFSSEIDEIARARQSDDPSLDQGAWQVELREADWPFVARRCVELLETRSKDLRLAVWLAEARTITDGFVGLAASLELVGGLCERYWAELHPQPDENGHEQRIGNLCWIAARIPQLAAGVLPATAAEALCAQLAQARRCQRALAALERAVDERLGADGPGFSAARKALDAATDALAAAARAAGADVGAGAAPAEHALVQAPPLAAATLNGPVQSRAQALAQLRAIADYFRQAEPHSPVAYLADKAAEWGTQPLHVWLRSVVKDPASCSHLEEMLGIDGRER